jgi:hypothetical protein
VNGNRKQGYGAVELFNLPVGFPSQTAIQWQAPVSDNYHSSKSKLQIHRLFHAGSCVVTGRFAHQQDLPITGNETSDVVITVSLSTNKSFEWKDKNGDHLYQPLNAANNSIVEDSSCRYGNSRLDSDCKLIRKTILNHKNGEVFTSLIFLC